MGEDPILFFRVHEYSKDDARPEVRAGNESALTIGHFYLALAVEIDTVDCSWCNRAMHYETQAGR